MRGVDGLLHGRPIKLVVVRGVVTLVQLVYFLFIIRIDLVTAQAFLVDALLKSLLNLTLDVLVLGLLSPLLISLHLLKQPCHDAVLLLDHLLKVFFVVSCCINRRS